MDSYADAKRYIGNLKRYDQKVINKAKGRTHLDPTCLLEPVQHGPIVREHADTLSVEEFIRKYEAPNLPVCIDGIVQKWPAWTAWSPKALFRHYRHSKFRAGDDDDDYAVRLKLKYFMRYMYSQIDDSPLYIFDSRFSKQDGGKKLLDEYEVPKYFKEDLFRLVGDKRRPPFRWFLIGPKRSGSNVHIDPLGTSAWNALISGRKRWILFPPHTPKKIAKARSFRKEGEDDEPIDYFTKMLPRLKESMGHSLEYIEFVQYPGETVFVPGGWWHAVLNLDDTVAVTQNFVSSQNFPICWVQTRKGRRGMARLWYRRLKVEYPHLAAIADKLNADHRFDLDREREEHHRWFRQKVLERQSKRRLEKQQRQLVGQNEDQSSSSSGDLVDSDWTSLSSTFRDLPTTDEEQLQMNPEVGLGPPLSESIPRPPSPLHDLPHTPPPQQPQDMDITRANEAPTCLLTTESGATPPGNTHNGHINHNNHKNHNNHTDETTSTH